MGAEDVSKSVEPTSREDKAIPNQASGTVPPVELSLSAHTRTHETIPAWSYNHLLLFAMFFLYVERYRPRVRPQARLADPFELGHKDRRSPRSAHLQVREPHEWSSRLSNTLFQGRGPVKNDRISFEKTLTRFQH
jgi:hypothetical protein